jgi:hypothetical protein
MKRFRMFHCMDGHNQQQDRFHALFIDDRAGEKPSEKEMRLLVGNLIPRKAAAWPGGGGFSFFPYFELPVQRIVLGGDSDACGRHQLALP